MNDDFFTMPIDDETCTSTELAEVAGCSHEYVLHTVQALVDLGHIALPEIVHIPGSDVHGMEYRQCCYQFTSATRDDAWTVLDSLDPSVYDSLYKRWENNRGYFKRFNPCEEVATNVDAGNTTQEGNTTMIDFTNPAEAARAWALEYEGRMALVQEIERKDAEIDALISHRLDMVTVDEWRASNQLYLSQSDCIKLGQRATKLTQYKGETVQRQPRQIETVHGEIKDVTIGVYKRAYLDIIGANMGLIETE